MNILIDTNIALYLLGGDMPIAEVLKERWCMRGLNMRRWMRYLRTPGSIHLFRNPEADIQGTSGKFTRPFF